MGLGREGVGEQEEVVHIDPAAVLVQVILNHTRKTADSST
jgi:hypothetical protein